MVDGSGNEAVIELSVEGADAAELDRLTANLRRDLLQLDVDDVTRLHEGAAPPGSKAVELVAIGALVVAVGKAAGALAGVVRAVQSWVGNKPERKVRLKIGDDEIEISGATVEEQKSLVDSWLARHAAG